MEKKYITGYNDGLIRSSSKSFNKTYISPKLHTNLIKGAIKQAFDFYTNFLNKNDLSLDFDSLVVEYRRELSHAFSLNLFAPGSVREKDHLNFWCLGRILMPELYIESGVFIGSSLHAFIKTPGLKKVIAIDPKLHKLQVPKKDVPGGVFIDSQDFSQLELNNLPPTTLVYFDDHIDTADRISQAHEKGIKYLLFDDSVGFEGICQKLYPAIPTIPMIINYELLNPNDELSWTFFGQPSFHYKALIKKYILRSRSHKRLRVSLKITEDLITKCQHTRKLIKKWSKIPDLGDYIPQMIPEKRIDTSKFLIELNVGS